MRVVDEKKVIKLKIEYRSGDNDERHEVFDWLDKKYGEGHWTSTRSGPTGAAGVGLVCAEIAI